MPFARWRSIRFRLTAWYTGILVVTFAIAGVFVLFVVRDAAEDTIDNDLRARLAAVRDDLPAVVAGQRPAHREDALEDRFSAAPGGVWLQVADSAGHWVFQSDPKYPGTLPVPAASGLRRRGSARTIRIQGSPTRVLTIAVPGGVAEIGAPMDEFEEMFEQLRWALGLTSPLLLILACVGGYWMSGRALRPVDEIDRTVRRIGSRTLAERLALRNTDDELDRLSVTINQMLERLESAFKLVVQFTADASHELRTPVAIIRTTAEVTREATRSAEEHEEAWDQVVLQSERMSRLVDDLLLLARADAGHSDVTFEVIDLADIVAGATAEVKVLADASGLELRTSAPQSCPASGDPDAIRRLLLVLLDNAIKYTPAGGNITVRLDIEESPEALRAVIEVHDTGIGIGPDDLQHVFDRFYRVSTDRSRKTGGSGLGLAIAKWLASLHGGEIVVESEPGKGSLFRVLLPLISR
ncbi:MAG TPA: ATP-binding protein [Bryobacteraceae bacterium]|nr:ATP-binding protein [Bryobacteraceae bacterium]